MCLIVSVSFSYCNKTPALRLLNGGKGLSWVVGSVCGYSAQCSRPPAAWWAWLRKPAHFVVAGKQDETKRLECEYPSDLCLEPPNLCPCSAISLGQHLKQTTLGDVEYLSQSTLCACVSECSGYLCRVSVYMCVYACLSYACDSV